MCQLVVVVRKGNFRNISIHIVNKLLRNYLLMKISSWNIGKIMFSR